MRDTLLGGVTWTLIALGVFSLWYFVFREEGASEGGSTPTTDYRTFEEWDTVYERQQQQEELEELDFYRDFYEAHQEPDRRGAPTPPRGPP